MRFYIVARQKMQFGTVKVYFTGSEWSTSAFGAAKFDTKDAAKAAMAANYNEESFCCGRIMKIG